MQNDQLDPVTQERLVWQSRIGKKLVTEESSASASTWSHSWWSGDEWQQSRWQTTPMVANRMSSGQMQTGNSCNTLKLCSDTNRAKRVKLRLFFVFLYRFRLQATAIPVYATNKCTCSPRRTHSFLSTARQLAHSAWLKIF